MSDKELIKQEIIRLKNEQLSIFSKGENDEICGTALICIGVYNQLLSFINSLPEEPNEDLEEEILKEWKKHCHLDPLFNDMVIVMLLEGYQETAKHFVEWQKQQMKETLQTEYEKGRFDMQQEMMKDAVDGEYWDGSIYLDNRPTEYKDGDKVKIIILKTE